jgi:hypothetical protein
MMTAASGETISLVTNTARDNKLTSGRFRLKCGHLHLIHIANVYVTQRGYSMGVGKGIGVSARGSRWGWLSWGWWRGW